MPILKESRLLGWNSNGMRERPLPICGSTVFHLLRLRAYSLIHSRPPAMTRIIRWIKGVFVTFGLSSARRILVVSHAEHDEAIRIISARKATRVERKLYEKG
jgi:hypothetical protein